jgi:hypothetical protein
MVLLPWVIESLRFTLIIINKIDENPLKLKNFTLVKVILDLKLQFSTSFFVSHIAMVRTVFDVSIN